MPTSTKRKNSIPFLPALAAFALVCFIRHFKFTMSDYNVDLLSLDYSYGFIPYGFLGTVFQLLAKCGILTLDYQGAFNFAGLFTLIYYILLFVFYRLCLNHCPNTHKRNVKHLLLLLSVFAFPMFTTSVNYGGPDLYLNVILLASLILLVCQKLEWLILPLGIIGMCIYHNFIFTHAMLIFVLLIYKLFCGLEKERIKYGAILALFLISIVALFFYFGNYDYGKLPWNPGYEEYFQSYRRDNKHDFPVFIVLFSPYILGTLSLFYRMLKDNGITKQQKYTYLTLLFGSICILPMLLGNVYYGRYMFQLVFYYIAGIAILLSLGDSLLGKHFDQVKADVKKLTPMTFLWFLYPLLLTPFRSVAISASIHEFAEVLFTKLTYFIQP